MGVAFGPSFLGVRVGGGEPMGKQRADLDLAGASSLAGAFAFTAPEGLAAHGRAGAIGTHAENLAGGGIVHRGLGFAPPSHPGAHPPDHALDLPRVDFQALINEQILAGGLEAASPRARPAPVLGHGRGIARDQFQRLVQGKTADAFRRIVEVLAGAQGDIAQEREHPLGLGAGTLLARLDGGQRQREFWLVEERFEQAGGIRLDGGQQAGLAVGQAPQALRPKLVQEGRRFRAAGCQKRRNFFLRSGAAPARWPLRSGRRSGRPVPGSVCRPGRVP